MVWRCKVSKWRHWCACKKSPLAMSAFTYGLLSLNFLGLQQCVLLMHKPHCSSQLCTVQFVIQHWRGGTIANDFVVLHNYYPRSVQIKKENILCKTLKALFFLFFHYLKNKDCKLLRQVHFSSHRCIQRGGWEKIRKLFFFFLFAKGKE